MLTEGVPLCIQGQVRLACALRGEPGGSQAQPTDEDEAGQSSPRPLGPPCGSDFGRAGPTSAWGPRTPTPHTYPVSSRPAPGSALQRCVGGGKQCFVERRKQGAWFLSHGSPPGGAGERRRQSPSSRPRIRPTTVARAVAERALSSRLPPPCPAHFQSSDLAAARHLGLPLPSRPVPDSRVN